MIFEFWICDSGKTAWPPRDIDQVYNLAADMGGIGYHRIPGRKLKK